MIRSIDASGKIKMNTLNYNKQLLIAGIIFTLHNIEESIGFAHFVYPQNLNLPLHPQSVGTMIPAIILITIIAWGVLFWAYRQRNDIIKRNILTVLVVAFLFNAIFPHIAGAIILQRYVPAVISSVLLNLPYSIWMLPKIIRLHSSGKSFFVVAAIGMLIVLLLVIFVLIISNFLVQ